MLIATDFLVKGLQGKIFHRKERVKETNRKHQICMVCNISTRCVIIFLIFVNLLDQTVVNIHDENRKTDCCNEKVGRLGNGKKCNKNKRVL